MKNVRIGTRIAAGFAAVIAVAVALGLFAYGKVGGIEKVSAETTKKSLPGVYLAGQVQNGIQREFGLVLQHIGSADKGVMERAEADIQESRARNRGFRDEYQKLLSTDQERRLFDALMAARNNYAGVCDEALKLSHIGTTAAKKQAADLANEKLGSLEAAYLEAAGNVVSTSKSAADEHSQSVEDSVSGARIGVLVGICSAVFVAVLIAWFIVRSITRPLAAAVGLVNRVAQGDLTHTVEATSTDEFGRMLAAMNAMVDNLQGAANVAVKISEGDLSVEARALSEKDVLGQAQRKMVENLKGAVNVAVKISEGDLAVEVKALSERDVLGQAQRKMVENLKGAARVAVKISEGDLSVEAKALSEKDVLGQALAKMLANLRKTVSEVTAAAANVASGSEEMSSTAEQL
jgi:methyl-accepting chemotaxis protein